MSTPRPGIDRPIEHDERSGVLHPGNLRRYDARWIEPDVAVRVVVDRYWHVRWHLPDDEAIDQRILDLPAITVSIEEGDDVPAPFVVTGVSSQAWMRRISGGGAVFGIRLRPAGLTVVSDLTPEQVADATVPLTPRLDADLHALVARVATENTPEARARAADAAIRERIARRPPPSTHLLANDVLDELRARVRQRTGASLGDHLGLSERTVQRALAATLGRGPKWIGRRIRLQEVALALATRDDDLATIAAELGYADQAHLTSDFRATTDITPGAYRRDLRRLAATGHGQPCSASR